MVGPYITAEGLASLVRKYRMRAKSAVRSIVIIGNHVIRVEGLNVVRSVNEAAKMVLDCAGWYGMQLSKDLNHVIYTPTQAGSAGYNAIAGKLGQYSAKVLDSATIFPYKCSDADRAAVIEALSDRVVLNVPERKASHPVVKFIAEHLADDILDSDYSGRSVVVVGPKFEKKEANAFSSADWVHFCTKQPSTRDVARMITSVETLRRKRVGMQLELETSKKLLETAQKSLEKFNFAGTNVDLDDYADKASQLGKYKERILGLEAELLLVDEKIKALEARSSVESSVICNVGAENCVQKCDVMIALDSVYDIDLVKLMNRATRSGAKEVLCTAILPFGLKVQPVYHSSELNVTFFRRKGKMDGFVMGHSGDLNNGYVHDNKSFMKLMYHQFIEADECWKYEIVRNIAEVCLLRFTRANDGGEQLVRREFPSSYDKYRVMYNPLLLFGPVPRHELIMVDEHKYSSAVSSVARYEGKDKHVEKTYAQVQSLFYRVAVGNVELQPGGTANLDVVDAITLGALLEGTLRRFMVSTSFGRGKPRGFLGRIWQRFSEKVVEQVADWFPEMVAFFTQDKVERFIRNQFSMREQFMISCAHDRSTHLGRAALFLEQLPANVQDRLPSLMDLLTGDAIPTSLRSIYDKVTVETEPVRVLRSLVRDSRAIKDVEQFSEAQKTYALMIDNLRVTARPEAGAREVAQVRTVRRNTHVLLKKQLSDQLKAAVVEPERVISDAESTVSTVVSSDVGDEVKAKRAARDSVAEEVRGMIEAAGAASELADQQEIERLNIPEALDSLRHTQDPIHRDGRMDEMSEAALVVNKMRMADKKLKKLSKGQVRKLKEKFTRKGEVANCTFDVRAAEAELINLRDNYFVDASTETAKHFAKLKQDVLALLKQTINGEMYKALPTKRIKVFNGYAGAGKTSLILESFDPHTSAYIAPFAKVLAKTNSDLKAKFESVVGRGFDFRVKTFEKIKDLTGDAASGKIMFIDEAGSLPVAFLLFLVSYFNYDEFWIIGDEEQTKFFDVLGGAGDFKFTDLVPDSAIERYYFTFRFGPTLAAFLNTTYNYPVFSLANHDTPIRFKDISKFNGSVAGQNISVTSDTVDHYAALARNMQTVKKSQGMTYDKVNLVYSVKDAESAEAFRETGIVGASRASKSVDFYTDITARSKAVANALSFAHNYAAVFDVVLPEELDFSDHQL